MPSITLPSKPGAAISYEYFDQPSSSLLVVFLNGLMLPAVGWRPVVSMLQAYEGLSTKPSALIYDRFGQGATTARDPLDEQPGKEAGYGHDFLDATKDLHELIRTVAPNTHSSLHLVLVGNSIGVHLARLYAQHYPSEVAGLLILDANFGNKEFLDIWPDPTAHGFDQSTVVADDCSFEKYVEACAKLPRMFNSGVKSPEGLDRRNLKKLLPSASEPKLKGSDGKGVWLTVVGHDPGAFAEESFKMMKVPHSLTKKFTDP